MIIETHDVGKRYGKVSVLQELNLQIPEGSAFALLGTNGAGKTTTLRTMVNIVQPSSGMVRTLGKPSTRLNYKDFWQIGYVSENQRLPDRLTVADYFDYLRSLYPGWDRGLEKELQANLDLPPDRVLNKLSHGMRMKTALAAALCFRPRLLILDEPLSGLDSLVRDEVVEGLLLQADETTIVISSHEVAEIENFTSHIAFMAKGRLLFQESIESLRARFRQVDVTLSSRKDLPDPIPTNWLTPTISGHALQFVDSDYQEDSALLATLNSHFGAVRFTTEAMNLRAITKAMIRSSRGISA